MLHHVLRVCMEACAFADVHLMLMPAGRTTMMPLHVVLFDDWSKLYTVLPAECSASAFTKLAHLLRVAGKHCPMHNLPALLRFDQGCADGLARCCQDTPACIDASSRLHTAPHQAGDSTRSCMVSAYQQGSLVRKACCFYRGAEMDSTMV